MVQLKSPVLMAFAIGSAMAMAIPKPVDGSAVAVRDAEPETYPGTFINRYDEISEKDKREAEPESKATYSGTFINRYDEISEKDKREAEAEAEPESKATYSGTFINRYDEVAE